MKKFFSNVGDYIDKKKAEQAAEAKAWREVHEALVKADAMGEAGAAKVGEGWGDLEESGKIQDAALSDRMGDAATAKIAEGMDELEASGQVEQAIESTALNLAKGDAHVRNMHKYMQKPAPIRLAPYM